MLVIAPARFSRIIAALSVQFTAGIAVGAEWVFMIGYETEVRVWCPRTGYLVMQVAAASVFEEFPVLATATVCPGESRAYDVIAGNGLVIGETRGAEAAFSIALEHLVDSVDNNR